MRGLRDEGGRLQKHRIRQVASVFGKPRWWKFRLGIFRGTVNPLVLPSGRIYKPIAHPACSPQGTLGLGVRLVQEHSCETTPTI